MNESQTTTSGTVQQKAKCQAELDTLFDKYGPNDIVLALSNRCKGEAGIAQGEGRGGDSNKWGNFADELVKIEVPGLKGIDTAVTQS
jgi:hypothetical protein